MTTKIADIYDATVTAITTALPSYIRMPNPYVLDQNTYLHLRHGFGIRIDDGRNTERYVGCLVTWERIFTIILVQQVTTTQNNTDQRVVIEKAILDDHRALLNSFEIGSTLGGTVIKAVVTDDQGVRFLDEQLAKFLVMEIRLAVEYQEDPRTP